MFRKYLYTSDEQLLAYTNLPNNTLMLVNLGKIL